MSGLFGGSTPKVEPPKRMPDPEDPALLEARRKRQLAMTQRSGRQSTILSEGLMGSAGVGSRGRLGA
jgi:hypothetical protein